MFVIDLQRFTRNLKVRLCVRIISDVYLYEIRAYRKLSHSRHLVPIYCTKQNMMRVPDCYY
jgi:hypothetical protein